METSQLSWEGAGGGGGGPAPTVGWERGTYTRGWVGGVWWDGGGGGGGMCAETVLRDPIYFFVSN